MTIKEHCALLRLLVDLFGPSFRMADLRLYEAQRVLRGEKE